MSGTAHIQADSGREIGVPVTRELARFTASRRFGDLPHAVVTAARFGMADLLGCALAGMREEVCTLVAAGIADSGGTSTLWGLGGRKASAEDAALVNGVAAHALALDDTNESMRGHPSAPIVPAILALGEEVRADGKDLLAAYAVGVEIACKLGRMANDAHARAGWHTTSTLGTMGAAAAACHLLRLDAGRTCNALALSASLAGGVRGNFGSMVKPLMAGVAARNGIVAARMAMAGVTARADAIEAREGFLALQAAGNGADLRTILATLGEPWELEDGGLVFKIYPNCSLMHTGIDMAIEARGKGLVEPRDIAAVHFEISPRLEAMRFLGPANDPQEARFKVEFCLAYALVHGRLGPEAFTPRHLADPDVAAMMDRITVTVGQDFPADNGDYSWLHVRHHGQPAFAASRSKQKGHPHNPLGPEEMRAKFQECCAAGGVSRDKATALWTMMSSLETQDSALVYSQIA